MPTLLEHSWYWLGDIDSQLECDISFEYFDRVADCKILILKFLYGGEETLQYHLDLPGQNV